MIIFVYIYSGLSVIVYVLVNYMCHVNIISLLNYEHFEFKLQMPFQSFDCESESRYERDVSACRGWRMRT